MIKMLTDEQKKKIDNLNFYNQKLLLVAVGLRMIHESDQKQEIKADAVLAALNYLSVAARTDLLERMLEISEKNKSPIEDVFLATASTALSKLKESEKIFNNMLALFSQEEGPSPHRETNSNGGMDRRQTETTKD